MKVYLVIDGDYYDPPDIPKAFTDKARAKEYIKIEAEERNEKRQPGDEYRYKMKEDGLSWNSPVSYLRIQEIELE